jgi:3-hydroxybutyrate dehydrogenase
MSLAKKLALVTGSTSGIGLGIAKRLVAAGADLVMTGFVDDNELQGIIKSVEAERYGAKVRYIGADLMKVDDIEKLVDEAGRVDILCNNAGVQHVSSIEDFTTEKWEQLIGVNLSAVFHTTRCVLPGMKSTGYGRIINIASAHGLVASANKSAYCAAKHGVIGLTKVHFYYCMFLS